MKSLLLIPISSGLAEIITHPIDFVKTQKQYYKTNISSIHIFKKIFKTQGVRGFYSSISPAIARHWVYTTTRVGLYENLRTGESDFKNKFIAGSVAGGMAQLIASPTDLIKIKLQTQQLVNKHKNKQTSYNIIKKIYKTQGIKGFYYGWKPNVARAISVNLGELVAYDTGKQFLLNYLDDNIYCHGLASLHSGFWSSLLSTPADVVKTRMMADSKHTMYSITKNIIQKEGFFSLWKGFIPIWCRLAPWQFVFWVSYEQLRAFNNMEGF